MEDLVNAFWNKSIENLEMFEFALTKGKFNVAASRYYYALRHAVNALLEKNQVDVPAKIKRDDRLILNPNPGTWPRPEMHLQAKHALSDYHVRVDRLMNRIWKLRILGDYRSMPVEEHQIEFVKRDADGLFQIIQQRIEGDQDGIG